MVKHTIIRKFLISYLLLLIIPIVSSIVIYFKTADMVESDIITSNLQILKDSRTILDKELENLDNTTKRLITNGDVNSFFNTGEPFPGSSEFFKVIRASYEVHSYSINTEFITDILLYAKTSDIILSTERVHTELETDYPFYFQFGSMSYRMWEDAILNSYYHHSYLPATMVNFSGNPKAVIPFIQSVPFHNRKYSKGNIIGFIDLDVLHALLERLNHEGMGCVYLIDEEGEILTYVGTSCLSVDPTGLLKPEDTSIENQHIDGKEWLVSQTTSNITGFKILSVLPSDYIEGKVSYIMNIIGAITLGILIIGIIFAVYLSYRSSKPVLEIADIAKEQLESGNRKIGDLDLIKSSMTELIKSNNELSDYKQAQLPINRNSYLEKLLQGNIGTMEQMDAMIRYHEISLESPPFNVVLIHIRGYGSLLNEEILSEKELIRIIITDTMQKRFGDNGYYLQLDTDTIAWVYEERDEMIKRELLRVKESLHEDRQLEVLISRGCPHERIEALSSSYTEAKQGMEYLMTMTRGTGVSNYDELPSRTDAFCYSVDQESKLIIYVKTGLLQETSDLLDEIYRMNFDERDLSVFMMSQLLRSLLNTLIRLNEFFLEEGIARKELNTISSLSSAGEEFTEIRKLFTTLVLKAADLENTELNHLKQEVIGYLHAHFSNQNLNLSMLADHFDYKESYLYHFFIDSLGQSFASYLESVRLEKACEFLRDTDNSIDRIAEMTGYGSAHSFRRAFKRRYDVSPSVYKKSTLTSIIL